jgi:hypothetical protein
LPSAFRLQLKVVAEPVYPVSQAAKQVEPKGTDEQPVMLKP